MTTVATTKERSKPRDTVVCSALPSCLVQSYAHQSILDMAIDKLQRLHEKIVAACKRCEDDFQLWIPDKGFGFRKARGAAEFVAMMGWTSKVTAAARFIRLASKGPESRAYRIRFVRRTPPKRIKLEKDK